METPTPTNEELLTFWRELSAKRTTVTLFCLARGETTGHAFSVTLSLDSTVSDLQKAIKREKPSLFGNLDADGIDLWTVSLSIVPDEMPKNESYPDRAERLLASQTIQDVCPTPKKGYVHILAHRTPPKRVRCHVTFGRKNPATFVWAVTRKEATLGNFKDKLRRHFEFPDGTEDRHIVINLELAAGSPPFQLITDTELVETLWDGPADTLWVFTIDTAQQAFSSWTFARVKTLFGLKADSYDTLATFEAGVADTPEEHRTVVLNELLRRNKVFPAIAGANEATRSEYISVVLSGVASLFDDVTICPQYELAGSHGKGPVDWAIKSNDTIIAITEAKKEDLNQGVGQNVIQLQAAHQRNRKRTRDEADLEKEVLYGIVTTAIDWVIIKVISDGDDQVDVFLSSLTPFPLPLNKPKLTSNDIAGPLKELFGQIKWLLDDQLSSPKRRRVT